MKVIFEGSETEIAKIVKENSVRVRRGLLSIAYVTPEEEAETPVEETLDDSKEVSMDDSKEVSVEEKKAPAKGKGKSK